ncbi:MAG: carboxylesterase family protein [Bacteroidetes bacterium]|nr:carboxylesterase family protein [Bacteroidota bacterium]
MIRTLLLSLLLTLTYVTMHAQYCTTDGRFRQDAYFSDAQIVSDTGIVYGQAFNYQGQWQNLILNVHYPDRAVDSLPRRPLIVLVHGGSFLGGNLRNLDDDCIEFAKRGFVAATVEYRLGWGAATQCHGDTTSAYQAIYRAIQDVHASLRYLSAHAQDYGIDTAWIFAGGNSAGSFATVNLAFVNQQEFDQRVPFCRQTLGTIDTSGNALRTPFRLRGLFHNWGSIIDIRFLRQAEAIPIVSFGGDQDIISHIDSGNYQNCANYPFMWGSRAIYQKLTGFGLCSELNVKVGGGHGVYNDDPAANLFRTQHAVCFFRSLFCDQCTTVYRTDSVSADCTALGPNGIADAIPAALHVYPNPATSQIEISGITDESTLTLTDMSGRVVYTTVARADAVVPCSAPDRGIYLLEIHSRQARSIHKVVLE